MLSRVIPSPRITFKGFLRYGVPITALQLGVAALFLTLRFLIWPQR